MYSLSFLRPLTTKEVLRRVSSFNTCQSEASGGSVLEVMGQEDISTMYPVRMEPPSKVDPYQASVKLEFSASMRLTKGRLAGGSGGP